jgi:hypothetical protein
MPFQLSTPPTDSYAPFNKGAFTPPDLFGELGPRDACADFGELGDHARPFANSLAASTLSTLAFYACFVE